jgi:D-alanyl-D-alanine carboxypeptidase/D-alanyl-D-alanine-endopeptidase (penicillin-binding protein 4)
MSSISTPKIRSLFPFRILLVFLWLLCIAQLQISYAGNLDDLHNLVGDQDAVLVTDTNGSVLFSKNADRQLIPASTLKILTALVALDSLGPGHRFITEFYLDQEDNLIVKGYGDPLLISEALVQIATVLATRLDSRQKRINDLVLDASYFDDPIVIPGVTSSYEPYDSPGGALCVNFNTVNFKRNTGGVYVSAEPQTPLLPFALDRIRASGLQHGRIILSRKANESTLYAGHLMSYFLKQQGIDIKGRIRIGRVRKEADKLIFKYVSEFSIQQVVAKLFEHSNNFMANQLLVATGAHVYGPPGTLPKAVRTASIFAKNVLKINNFKIVEGSGISRANKISAHNLHIVLEEFAPHYHLMVRDGRAFYKTGTLSNISTRAGYIENSKGELYRFVILINTPGKTTGPIMKILLNSLD